MGKKLVELLDNDLFFMLVVFPAVIVIGSIVLCKLFY